MKSSKEWADEMLEYDEHGHVLPSPLICIIQRIQEDAIKSVNCRHNKPVITAEMAACMECPYPPCDSDL